MKYTARTILGFLLIPLLLIGVILSTVRFQLLEPTFWQKTFRNNNVYSNLATVLKDTAEKQTVSEGGSLQEARVLTNLITPANLQDFIEKNLNNLLNYANGKTKEAVVYIPLKIIPKGLLPTNLGKVSENTPLPVLLSEFHIVGVQKAQIETFARTGQAIGYLLALDTALILLILLGLFMLADKDKRFTAPAVAFIVAGVFALVLSLLGFIIRGSMFTDWVKGTEPSQHILAPFAPYILGEIIKVWAIAGAFALLAGIVLIFLKKK